MAPIHRVSAILRSRLPYAQKQAFIEQTRKLDAQAVKDSQDFSLLRWFHDNCVPQVMARQVKYAPPFGQTRSA